MSTTKDAPKKIKEQPLTRPFLHVEHVGNLVRIWLHDGNHFYITKEQAKKLKQSL